MPTDFGGANNPFGGVNNVGKRHANRARDIRRRQHGDVRKPEEGGVWEIRSYSSRQTNEYYWDTL